MQRPIAPLVKEKKPLCSLSKILDDLVGNELLIKNSPRFKSFRVQ